ncbi:MAG TPA: hypothetical protein VL688_07865 [Verrucomicrobiae bacterium]|nr:hypothetical protein [Verrucomicrobiae bacterium]
MSDPKRFGAEFEDTEVPDWDVRPEDSRETREEEFRSMGYAETVSIEASEIEEDTSLMAGMCRGRKIA